MCLLYAKITIYFHNTWRKYSIKINKSQSSKISSSSTSTTTLWLHPDASSSQISNMWPCINSTHMRLSGESEKIGSVTGSLTMTRGWTRQNSLKSRLKVKKSDHQLLLTILTLYQDSCGSTPQKKALSTGKNASRNLSKMKV